MEQTLHSKAGLAIYLTVFLFEDEGKHTFSGFSVGFCINEEGYQSESEGGANKHYYL